MTSKVFLVFVIAAICFSATHAAPRNKRSFSWLPGFLGGGGGGGDAVVAAEDPAALEEEVEPVVDNRIQGEDVVSGPYAGVDPSVIGSIVSNGQVINNQVHYPIWRIQKYQGLNLQPLPVHLVPGGAENVFVNPQQAPMPGDFNVNVEAPTPVDATSDRLPPSTVEKIESWLTPELIQMARSYGVTDFSKVPSLEDAMNILGTTTKEDTIAAIKEFASTEGGRDLIRQFVAGSQDNEVAESENIETVAPAQNPEAAQYAEVLKNYANYELDGDSTQYFGQYLLPHNQAQLIAQYGTFGNGPAQSEAQSEADDEEAETETTTPPTLFGRISQWTSFLNPFSGRQEIPIPPSKVDAKDAEEDVALPLNANEEQGANQNTVPIPELPELPPLPSVPGVEEPLPELPKIHIPTQYVPPTLSNGAVPRVGGPYVRVKLPLAGFNPTPQYQIEPQFLQYARNQLSQPVVQIPPYPVVYKPAGVQRPVSVYQRIATTHTRPITQQQPIVVGEPTLVGQPVAVSKPIDVSQPVDFNKQIYPQGQVQPSSDAFGPKTFEQSSVAPVQVDQPISVVQSDLQTPQIPAEQFEQIATVPGFPVNVPNVGQLPLDNANYQVFANAPRIVDSYGAPAVPFQYFHNGQPNSFWVSPQANSVNILQEYDLQPAASQTVERTANAGEQSEVEEEVEEEEKQLLDDEQPEQQEEEEQQEEIVERSNGNDEVAPDANQNNEDQSQQQKVIDSVKAEAKEEVKQVAENVDNELEADVKVTPSTESTVHRNMRPSLKIIKNQNEKKSATSNIQRVVRQDSAATGIVYRANQKTAEWLPLSIQHAMKTNAEE